MIRQSQVAAVAVLTAFATQASAASITDLTTWALLEDPPHPGMTAFVSGPTSAMLDASGPVPSGTDIGYASVNGADVASSTSGYYFDPASDFAVAIDFDIVTRSTTGAGGIGFGIGEDTNGTDSAGVGLGFIDGVPISFSTAGRVGNADEPLQLFSTGPDASSTVGGAVMDADGRFFVEYDASSGDVIVGVSTTPGAATPDETKTLTGIATQWDDEPLLVSFFSRSQSVLVVPGIQSGLIRTTFSDVTVLSGTPIPAVPEPTSLALVTGLAALVTLSRRR